MNAVTVYVPSDTAARSVRADQVADAIVAMAAARNIPLNLIRNGTRAMMWLEPLVEVACAAGRMAYGPVRVQDVPGLFDAGFIEGKTHPLGHGLTENIPWLRNQNRLTFARLGITDPLDPDDYITHGGLTGLQRSAGPGWGGVSHRIEMADGADCGFL